MLKRQLNIFKNEYFVLIIIVIAASIIRLWGLGDVGFNNDEAIYSGQAATLAGYEEYGKFFSIFRAHPVFLQFVVSIFFSYFGISDTIARTVPVIFGILTVIVVYFIGKLLYNRNVAIVAATVIAIIPYHIIVSREVLIDVPLSFFFTLTLYFLVRYMKNSNNIHWLYFVGVSSGLGFLSKEVGIFALISSIIALLFIRRFTLKSIFILLSSFILVASAYFIPILTLEEANDAWLSYWEWQTQREANHSDTFYVTTISKDALGYMLTTLCIISIIFAIVTRTVKKPGVFLLLIWIAVPIIIFHILPIKGFHFVMSLIPAFTILGVSFLFSDWVKKVPYYRIIPIVFIPLILISSGSVLSILFGIPFSDDVGSGGEPYAREAARWIRDYIPNNGTILTMDTPMANIIKYYSNNEAYSLHSNKNPAYTKILNSDLSILNGDIEYLVYEGYRLDSSPYLLEESDELIELVEKYNGIPIYTEYETLPNSGKNLTDPALIIYSLNIPG